MTYPQSSKTTYGLFLLLMTLGLFGCTTERIIERPVPIQPPSLCLQSCPYSTDNPQTNGQLLEAFQAQREALACYESRLQCVREMAGK